MDDALIRRINELARLAKERALTSDELAERDMLRKEYISEFRKATIDTLENTYVVTPDGSTSYSVKDYFQKVKDGTIKNG